MNNKLALAAFVATATSIANAQGYTGGVHYIWDVAKSGLPTDRSAGFVEQPNGGTLQSWYVHYTSGAASNRNTPAVQLIATSEWVFDFTDPSLPTFTGTLYLPSHRIQSVRTLGETLSYDGRTTLSPSQISVSGRGTYDEDSNTFTYYFLNPTVAGGGASTFSQSGSTSCVNGQTSPLGKICLPFPVASPAWEGLALNFVFAEDRNSFTGTLQGIDTHGSGLFRVTRNINWTFGAQVPVPTTAWLFGSALAGLAISRRRRPS